VTDREGRLQPTLFSGAELPDDRPKIAVAHRVDDSGMVERVHAELVRRLLDRCRFTIVASNVAEDLRERVDWRRVPLPQNPIPLRFLFCGLVALRLRRARTDLVHVCGAVFPNRADMASVHFCHAGSAAASGRLAPESSSQARRLNTSFERCLAIDAERLHGGSGR
jgi:hypothetical protein